MTTTQIVEHSTGLHIEANLIAKDWVVPLLYNLGYLPSFRGEAEVIDNQSFAISHRAGNWGGEVAKSVAKATTATPPIHISGCRIRLDQKPPSGNPKLSAHRLMQKYLNPTEHL